MARMQTPPTDALGPTARILMVDDDPGIRDVVSDFLGRHGYAVTTAGDAREMEQALERDPVDLIVLDVMLPGEDGLAICRRLAVGEAPPIIMLSAMGEPNRPVTGAAKILGPPASSPAGDWTWCAGSCARRRGWWSISPAGSFPCCGPLSSGRSGC